MFITIKTSIPIIKGGGGGGEEWLGNRHYSD